MRCFYVQSDCIVFCWFILTLLIAVWLLITEEKYWWTDNWSANFLPSKHDIISSVCFGSEISCSAGLCSIWFAGSQLAGHLLCVWVRVLANGSWKLNRFALPISILFNHRLNRLDAKLLLLILRWILSLCANAMLLLQWSWVAVLSYGTKSPMKSLSRLKDTFSRQCCSVIFCRLEAVLLIDGFILVFCFLFWIGCGILFSIVCFEGLGSGSRLIP
jgi:hypothetical protein